MKNRSNPEYWKMGFVYYNPKDRSLMVPKLNGLGWTLNFGHKALLRYVLIFLVLVAVYVAGRYFYAI